MLELDIQEANDKLRHAAPAEVVRWALDLDVPTIATTSMGRNAAVMLHLVSQVNPDLPTIWVDTGYNLRDTYIVAERLIKHLQLNIHVYSPLMTSERRNAIMGGIPTVDEEERHEEFTRQVKLEPLDNRGIIKVAPIFYWSDDEVEAYMEAHQLPTCRHYFDPTKVSDGRECGLHTAA